jgi:hypothetical protein
VKKECTVAILFQLWMMIAKNPLFGTSMIIKFPSLLREKMLSLEITYLDTNDI